MTSKQLQRVYALNYWYTSKLKYLPFDCEKKSYLISFTKSKLSFYNWLGLSFLVLSVSIFLGGRLLYEYFHPDPKFTIPQIFLYLVFFLVTVITDVFNVNLIWKGKETATVINGLFILDDLNKEKFKKFKPWKEPKVDLIALWLGTYIPISFTAGLVVAPFAVLHEIGPIYRFMKECIPTAYYQWWPSHLLAIMVIYHGYVFCLLVVLVYIQAAIISLCFGKYWLKSLTKCTSKIPSPSPPEKQSKEEIKRRIILQDELQEFHGIVSSVYTTMTLTFTKVNDQAMLIAPTLLGIAFLLTQLTIYANICLHAVIPMPYFLFFPFLNVFLFVAESILLPDGAKINEESRHFIHLVKGKMQTRYMQKWARSLRPLGVQIGPFFYLERSTTFTFLAAVLDNSINLLLTF